MIADVLLDEAFAVLAADHRVGQIKVLDYRLQLAAVEFRDFAAEDRGDLVWLPDGAVGVEEAFTELVERGATVDEVVAKLDLGEEQAVLAAGVFSFSRREERRESGKPFLAAGDEVTGRELVGKLLQSFRLGAAQESVGALTKANAHLAHRLASQ